MDADIRKIKEQLGSDSPDTRIEGMSSAIAAMLKEAASSTALVTCCAHETPESVGLAEVNIAARDAVIRIVRDVDGEEMRPDSMKKILRRVVLAVRDEVEFALGVRERPE